MNRKVIENAVKGIAGLYGNPLRGSIMMICDGEILIMECEKCGHRFRHIIGYGPICPTPWLRRKRLKENPPVCPECGSKNVKEDGFLM